MAEIDLNRLVWIVVGVQLPAELGDRALAYRIEQQLREKLDGLDQRLSPAVISDVYYLNNEEAQSRPVISVGGPGVNALTSQLINVLPTVLAIENTLVIQMDLEMADPRAAVWGMDHIQTVKAAELFVEKGYLETFIKGLVRPLV
jgi:hypothetical protein